MALHRPCNATLCYACRLGMFDIDEFFMPNNSSQSLVELLRGYESEGVGGVAFNRLVRGSCTWRAIVTC